jgi:hypothetical protein
VALRRPRIALFTDVPSGAGRVLFGQSSGFARWVLERRFGITPRLVTNADLESGAFAEDIDVLVVPDGLSAVIPGTGTLPNPITGGGLSAVALTQIQAFVRDGGTYVGYRGQGIGVARAAGISTVTLRDPPSDFQVPGASVRVRVDAGDPLGWGAGGVSFVFDNADPILEPGTGDARPVLRFPASDADGFFVSGYTEGVRALAGTPAAVHTTFGAGHVFLMTFDPNYRGYAEAGQQVFANALLAPPPTRPGPAPARAVRPELLAERPWPVRDAVIRVAADERAALVAAMAAAGAAGAPVPASAAVIADPATGEVTLRVPGRELDEGDAPIWAAPLLGELAARGVRPWLIIM